MPSVISKSVVQTQEIAKQIWAQLDSTPTIIALEGELGAGKTTFVKALIPQATSPSFVLHTPYTIHDSKSSIQVLHHIDAWRLENFSELEKLGLAEMLVPNSVIIIEWADKFEKEIKRLRDEGIKLIWVKIGYGKSKNERSISYENFGH